MKKILVFAIMAVVLALSGCDLEQEPVFIEDNTGKKWDITHAVDRYFFKAAEFQYGLGPYAIQPILQPSFLAPGETGYPGDDETFEVLGVEYEGDVRAYPISVMSRYEVVDDAFGDVHVAVAY